MTRQSFRALDITLDLKGATKSQIERAMRGHVLANAELIGTYQKKRLYFSYFTPMHPCLLKFDQDQILLSALCY